MNDETERRLLANDPTLTEVDFNPQWGAAQAARAIVQSSNLCSVHISMELFDPIMASFVNGGVQDFRGTAIDQISHWISSSTALQELDLYGGNLSQPYREVLPYFLQSVRMRIPNQCRPLKQLRLFAMDVQANDLALLMHESSVSQFLMTFCRIEHDSFLRPEQARCYVAHAFASSKTLLRLSLDVCGSNITFICAILGALRSNTSIDFLSLWNKFDDDVQLPDTIVQAMADLFKSSVCPLRSILFAAFSWSEASFGPVARCIQNSPVSLETLVVVSGRFDDESTAHLQSIFESESGPLSMEHFHLSPFTRFPKADDSIMLQKLVGATARLKNLNLDDWSTSYSKSMRHRFQAVVRGLGMKSCSVRVLQLSRTLNDSRMITELLNTMPLFPSVVSISLGFSDTMARFKTKLMSAFRRNRTLLESDIQCNFLDASDSARLTAYHERNSYLQRTIEQAEEGDGTLLPSLFGVSEICNFVAFLVRKEDDIGPMVGQTKRIH